MGQRSSTSRVRWGGFALALGGALGLGGCDPEEESQAVPIHKACSEDVCEGAMVCELREEGGSNQETPHCLCAVGQKGATCARDTDCSSGERCGTPSCQCVPDGSGGAGGTAGTSGTGGTGAGGTGGLAPEFPPHTTDCLTDADGCLMAQGTSCEIVLDGTFQALTTTVEVAGALAVGGPTSGVTVFGYGQDLEYENAGYQAEVSFQTRSSGAGIFATLKSTSFQNVAEEYWVVPDGTYTFTSRATFDRMNQSARYALMGSGAPGPISSAEMGAPSGATTIVTLKDATVCRIAVSEQ